MYNIQTAHLNRIGSYREVERPTGGRHTFCEVIVGIEKIKNKEYIEGEQVLYKVNSRDWQPAEIITSSIKIIFKVNSYTGQEEQ